MVRVFRRMQLRLLRRGCPHIAGKIMLFLSPSSTSRSGGTTSLGGLKSPCTFVPRGHVCSRGATSDSTLNRCRSALLRHGEATPRVKFFVAMNFIFPRVKPVVMGTIAHVSRRGVRHMRGSLRPPSNWCSPSPANLFPKFR
jgi:hypothetical protein